MKKLLCSIVLLLFMSFEAYAQEWFTGITWEIAFATNDTKDFVGGTANFRGLGFQGRNMVKPNVSVGFDFNWNVLHEVTDETISLEVTEGDVTGHQNRIINSFPFLVTAHLYSRKSDGFVPYIGLGAGPYWIKSRLDIGVVAFTENNWHFGLAPEVGIGFRLGYDTHGLLSLKYNYAFEAGDAAAQSYFALNIGLVYF